MMSSLTALPVSDALPIAFGTIDPRAAAVMQQFFNAEIDNPKTRRAYMFGAADFFRIIEPDAGDRGTITRVHGWQFGPARSSQPRNTRRDQIAVTEKFNDDIVRFPIDLCDTITDFQPGALRRGVRFQCHDERSRITDAKR